MSLSCCESIGQSQEISYFRLRLCIISAILSNLPHSPIAKTKCGGCSPFSSMSNLMTEITNSELSTASNVLVADKTSLLVAPRPFLIHSLALWATHSVPPVRRSRIDDADPSPRAHIYHFASSPLFRAESCPSSTCEPGASAVQANDAAETFSASHRGLDHPPARSRPNISLICSLVL